MRQIKNLTDYQREILIGSLLGDGCLELGVNSKNPCLRISRSRKDKPYLLWQAEIFNNFLTEFSIRDKNTFDERTQKIYQGVSLRTECNPVFLPYYKEWYKYNYTSGHNTKILPSNLLLTPTIIAIWIADDGNIITYEGKRSYSLNLKIATHGFSEQEVIKLKFLLEERYNFKFAIYQDDGKFFIRLNKGANTKILLQDIDSAWVFPLERKSSTWRNNKIKIVEQNKLMPFCKFCGSADVYKNGFGYRVKQKVQKYFCKICKKQFIGEVYKEQLW